MTADRPPAPPEPSRGPAGWEPDSWRRHPARQQPAYADPHATDAVLDRIRGLPPIVAIGEVDALRSRLVEAARGRTFILQGGNCAERFLDCNAGSIVNKLKILLQMSVILTYGARRPVLRIGRIAGQYAKPRSNDTESVNGRELPVYRGDAVNSIEPEPAARAADPARLLSAYFHSVATINHIRALIESGFADLRRPHNWDLGTVESGRNWAEYRAVVERILDAIGFMESFGGVRSEMLGRVDFYTSHEGLLLGYEEALARKDPETGRWYGSSAHMLWIGARTCDPGGAHVEFFRGLANPIGIKIGPKMTPEQLDRLLEVLNPENEEGRITLITRFGAEQAGRVLPPLLRAVRETGRRVVWSCDPMHGNTVTLENGRKTREFSTILDELTSTFRIHQESGSHLGGVHFELTAEDVTECTGGSNVLTPRDLERRYETWCDPRLNDSQRLQMAFLIARLMQEEGVRGG